MIEVTCDATTGNVHAAEHFALAIPAHAAVDGHFVLLQSLIASLHPRKRSRKSRRAISTATQPTYATQHRVMRLAAAGLIEDLGARGGTGRAENALSSEVGHELHEGQSTDGDERRRLADATRHGGETPGSCSPPSAHVVQA